MSSWRTVIINEYCDLRYKDGLMVVCGKEYIEIAVSEVLKNIENSDYELKRLEFVDA